MTDYLKPQEAMLALASRSTSRDTIPAYPNKIFKVLVAWCGLQGDLGFKSFDAKGCFVGIGYFSRLTWLSKLFLCGHYNE